VVNTTVVPPRRLLQLIVAVIGGEICGQKEKNVKRIKQPASAQRSSKDFDLQSMCQERSFVDRILFFRKRIPTVIVYDARNPATASDTNALNTVAELV
jgi:hypothetical protein